MLPYRLTVHLSLCSISMKWFPILCWFLTCAMTQGFLVLIINQASVLNNCSSFQIVFQLHQWTSRFPHSLTNHWVSTMMMVNKCLRLVKMILQGFIDVRKRCMGSHSKWALKTSKSCQSNPINVMALTYMITWCIKMEQITFVADAYNKAVHLKAWEINCLWLFRGIQLKCDKITSDLCKGKFFIPRAGPYCF